MKKIICKKSKEKVLYNRNSVLYTGSVRDIDDGIREGDIIEIRKEDNSLVGYGFYFNGKQISAYIFDFTDKPKDIDYQYWKQKIINAYEFRKKIIPYETNVYRLIHSEGDNIPGLAVDVYDNIAVVEFKILGIEKLADTFFKILNELGFENIFVKKSVRGKYFGFWNKLSDSQGVVQVREYGLNFYVDIVNGQKTGFFIDQRENRNLIKKYSSSKTVLNLFAYTGGFSVYALAGNAIVVHSVDISKNAIDLCNKNVELNGFNEHRHSGIAENAFDYLVKMPEDYYDLIIIDPPAFAKSNEVVLNAAKGYKDLNYRAILKIKSGGIIFTFSCSQKIEKDLFRKIVFSAAADAKRNVKILHQLFQAPDHPIDIFQPKSEYLKGFVLLVE